MCEQKVNESAFQVLVKGEEGAMMMDSSFPPTWKKECIITACDASWSSLLEQYIQSLQNKRFKVFEMTSHFFVSVFGLDFHRI